MSTRNSWDARLRYEVDKAMAATPRVLIGWLVALWLLVIIIAGAGINLLRIAPEGDAGGVLRMVILAVTIGGITIVATLVGALCLALAARLETLRKRSPVLETDHTIILNWSPAIFELIDALAIGNRTRAGPCIVILSSRDRDEMEAEIAAKLPRLGKTRIICRRGDPTDGDDLRLTSPQTARFIIVLSPELGDERAADHAVIATVMALVHDPHRRAAPYRITTEIRHADSADLARAVGGTELQLVRTDALLARIMVQASRQPGLSAVYAELLDGAGHAIQTLDQPDLVGNVFGDSLMAYEGSTLIGLCAPDGAVRLNPPMDTVFTPGTKAILIAEANANVRISTSNITVDLDAIRAAVPRPVQAERTLLLGWNRRAKRIAYEVSRGAAPGSVLAIAADPPGLDAEIAALAIASDNLSVVYGTLDPTDRSALESLDLTSYDQVLVASDQPGDTRSLVTLLQLRQIADAAGIPLNVVSELTAMRNRVPAELVRAADL
ncbi:MAG TPA: hypothetical protein VL133_04305, partial [Devosia sp.]|nr:hypothetical protein [Devosia sp.]